MTGQSQIDIERPSSVVVDEQLIRDDDASDPTLQPSSFAAEPSVLAPEIIEALREVPSYGLGPDEVKAYRFLISSDNGRRLTSFLRLPKTLRRDWLLMEIKASHANLPVQLFMHVLQGLSQDCFRSYHMTRSV